MCSAIKQLTFFLLLSSVFFFIQCTSETNDTKVSIDRIEVDATMNRDTFYLDERCYVKIFLLNNDSNKITNIKFFYNDIYLPHSQNIVANASFLIKDSSPYDIDTVRYAVKAIFKKDSIVDSVVATRQYYISKALLNKRSEGSVVEGKREGKWRFWHDDNKQYLSRISIYKKGIRNGVDSVFYDPLKDNNNNLKAVQFYTNGLLNGSSIEYWSNGNILAKGSYKNGNEQGQMIRYSSSGKMVE